MIRALVMISCLALSVPAQAADNGGFGEAFSDKAPSALMEAPNSQIAQSVQTPSADDLQNIMPAAGEEETIPSSENKNQVDITKDILDAAPTTTHDEIPPE